MKDVSLRSEIKGSMDIKICISSLLAFHDCVIIPGFGGFIGNYSPARIDPVHHAFQPPSKKLLFNINLKQNDGLLASTAASSFGISYEEAGRLIDDFTTGSLNQIKAGKAVVIPGVGRLFSGREGIIQFEQDKTTNLLPEAFGLTSFISPPIVRNSLSVPRNPTSVPFSEQITKKGFHLTRSLKWAAVLAIPIAAAAIIGISQYHKGSPDPANDAGILSSVFSRFSSTSLVEKKEAPEPTSSEPFQYEATPSVFESNTNSELQGDQELTVSNEPVSGSGTINSPDLNSESFTTNAARVSGDLDGPVMDEGGRFIIIVGAFREKRNAENFVRKLQEENTHASIYDRSKSGLYRVTIGTFSQMEEASQLLATARAGAFSGAWLLKK